MAKARKKNDSPNMFKDNAERMDWNENEQREKILEENRLQEQLNTPEEKEERTIRISYSLITKVREYLAGGSCGVMINETLIKGRVFPAGTAAMKLGVYFEYILTGALPKDGQIPQPEYMKTPIKANIKAGREPLHGLTVEDMTEPYRTCHENAAALLKLWADIGLEVIRAGWKITKGRHNGTIDVVLRATRDITFDKNFSLKKGDLISGDLKYAGTGEDRWSKQGWGLFAESGDNLQKEYHGSQAKEYHYLSSLPQTFWVVDPKQKYILFFWCKIDQTAIDAHLKEGNDLLDRLIFLHKNGLLEPRPEFNKCADCELFKECIHKHTYPHPVLVDLTKGD
jgi:hypothetical protein